MHKATTFLASIRGVCKLQCNPLQFDVRSAVQLVHADAQKCFQWDSSVRREQCRCPTQRERRPPWTLRAIQCASDKFIKRFPFAKKKFITKLVRTIRWIESTSWTCSWEDAVRSRHQKEFEKTIQSDKNSKLITWENCCFQNLKWVSLPGWFALQKAYRRRLVGYHW